MTKKILLLMMLVGLTLEGVAQEVSPMAYYTDKNGDQKESNSIDDGEAPLAVHFQANPTEMGDNTPSYEWHFKLTHSTTTEAGELFVRYEENTDFTFTQSGTYSIELRTYLKAPGSEELVELSSTPITVSIAESKLEFPNAFSPNGDGVNDIYRAKPDYKSIVSFRAIILNRWGQKLYEWNDPAGGWDGKYKGNDVKQGVYFVYVEAKGGDGVEYKIRKDVNLLRGYTDTKGTTDGGN